MASSESDTNTRPTVLVTGGSSFLGGHTILKLLETGRYSIRTTVRSLPRVENTRSNLRHGGATEEQVADIDIVIADLITDNDETWTKACAGIQYVIHIAGMIPTGKEKRLEELLDFLRPGALRLMRAAKTAGVHKVVFTSSIATIAHGHGSRDKSEPFTEEDWTDLSGSKETVHIYPRAKTLTEQAVWEYVNEGKGKGMQLTVICPAAMYGPSLDKDYRASLKLILILCGGTPGMPYYGTGMVRCRSRYSSTCGMILTHSLLRWTFGTSPTCTSKQWKPQNPTDSAIWPFRLFRTAAARITPRMYAILWISRPRRTFFATVYQPRRRRKSQPA